ncbi:MAG: hypothetical protein R3E01_29330 [Pirellulaceae bacterium]|nr:hypothetical protein [Planctomycetales bacterium]
MNSTSAIITFLAYTVGVLVLAWFSHRVLTKKKFLGEYFLGSRGLGVLTLTLTYGATAASAGSFAGFPALIYRHGWVLALWIASYMVVPLCGMGLLGKRLNQVARKSGAITLPDVLRDRFRSGVPALVTTMLLVFLLSFYLIPQFKLGAIVLNELLGDNPTFHDAVAWLGNLLQRSSVLPADVDPEYLVCLLLFTAVVVVYTTYGGFRAVVWTDVMQGIVMIVGVLVLLVLALARTGGLDRVTRQMAEMTPPRTGSVVFHSSLAVDSPIRIASQIWFDTSVGADVYDFGDAAEQGRARLFCLNESVVIGQGQTDSNAAKVVQITTPEEIARVRKGWLTGSPPPLPDGITASVVALKDYAYGAGEEGVYISAPGPAPAETLGFLPIGLALSFFFYWALSATGQPASMVRMMAFNSSRTLRWSLVWLTVYFGLIYFPLVVIFCCARVILPGMDETADSIMPAIAFELSSWAKMPWLAGLLIAAPFAAAMSTVDSIMLMISSSIVRDVYQRELAPDATERSIKRLSYACMLTVGIVVFLGAVRPPDFLQFVIVFAGGGMSVSFLIPVLLAVYWPRCNTPGVVASMLGGLAAYLALYLYGYAIYEPDRPYRLLQMDPLIWGFAASLILGVVVSLITAPPAPDLVRKYFGEIAPAGDTT